MAKFLTELSKKIVLALIIVCICYSGDLPLTPFQASAESIRETDEQTKREMVVIVKELEAMRLLWGVTKQ